MYVWCFLRFPVPAGPAPSYSKQLLSWMLQPVHQQQPVAAAAAHLASWPRHQQRRHWWPRLQPTQCLQPPYLRHTPQQHHRQAPQACLTCQRRTTCSSCWHACPSAACWELNILQLCLSIRPSPALRHMRQQPQQRPQQHCLHHLGRSLPAPQASRGQLPSPHTAAVCEGIQLAHRMPHSVIFRLLEDMCCMCWHALRWHLPQRVQKVCVCVVLNIHVWPFPEVAAVHGPCATRSWRQCALAACVGLGPNPSWSGLCLCVRV